VRILLTAAVTCCATFGLASCAPVPTARVGAIPASASKTPALAAVVSKTPAPATATQAPVVSVPAPESPATAVADADTTPAPSPNADSTPRLNRSALFGLRIIAMHNEVREAAGVEPIHWDSSLAAAAKAYAQELAKSGRWAHSAMADRPGQGENLWMGTHAAFRLDEMVGAWAREGRMFHAGAFPAVSKTGNWDDVGHYTQMIWPGSIRVGCAVGSSARYDYLVCRYSPAGNVMGSTALVTASVNKASLKFARGPVTSNSALD